MCCVNAAPAVSKLPLARPAPAASSRNNLFSSGYGPGVVWSGREVRCGHKPQRIVRASALCVIEGRVGAAPLRGATGLIRKEKVKEGKVKEVLCRSGAARASSSAAFPKQQLGERSRIVVAAQFALAHPRGGSQQEGRKKEEGIPPAEAAHHDVSADHPEAAW